MANLHGDKLNMGIVDCDSQGGHDLCTAFDVTAYPRLQYINSENNYYRYKGQRNIEDFEEYIFQGGFEKEKSQGKIPFLIFETDLLDK